LFAAVTVAAFGDVIYLKNGRTIYADRTREVGNRIEYEVGENTFGIPKSTVDHIGSGGSAPVNSSSISGASSDEPPPIAASGTVKHADTMESRIIRDGGIDMDALRAADTQDNPEIAAAAFFTAGKFELNHGNPEKARQYLNHALTIMPNNGIILEHYVAVLEQMHRFVECLPYAQQAVRLSPASADAHALLAFAYFNSERTGDAVKEWKRALEIHEDATVRAWLERAEREAEAEQNFGEQASGHFTIRYEGAQAPLKLRMAIVNTLEAHYNDLVREFGISPRDNIIVSLYTGQSFFDVTRAPSWKGAVNDGKLRIPIEGLDSVTPELSRVLKHELAHSFISQITRNRCPTWLNEGIAQKVEPQNVSEFGSALARLYARGGQIPLNQLEGSFMGFGSQMAMIAYGESLGAVDYIVSTYGMSDAVRILKRIGEGASTESAMRSVLHSGYESFEGDIGTYYKKTYGE
jgi:tetratricopeptide (TPR) repeat protein